MHTHRLGSTQERAQILWVLERVKEQEKRRFRLPSRIS